MHEPIENHSVLNLLNLDQREHFLSESLQPHFQTITHEINNSFWKTAQTLLLATMKSALPETCSIAPYHKPNYSFNDAPAFAYDIKISNLDFMKNETNLSENQLVLLNKHARKVIKQKTDYLPVNLSRADLTSDEQDFYLEDDKDSFQVYSCYGGSQFERQDSPLFPNTSFIYHFSVTNFTKIVQLNENEAVFRVQGIALPNATNPEVYRLLERAARKFVANDLLSTIDTSYDEYGDKVDLDPLYGNFF